MMLRFDVYLLMQSILILFVILDSIGNAPIFYSLTAFLDLKERRNVISLSVIVATLILFIFALVGTYVLSFFNITVDDFRIAGGIILFIFAIQGILGKVEAEYVEREAVAIVPMATPLLAGPGAITTVIYLSQVYGVQYSITSIFANALISYILLINGEKLLSTLGKNGTIALSRIMAIILAAIAISMIRNGILNILNTFRKEHF